MFEPTLAEKVEDLRHALVVLHKKILEYEQHVYEGQNGKIPSPTMLYDLVLKDPHFSWIQALSALVVSIDELQDTKKPIDAENAQSLFQYTQKLLRSDLETSPFDKGYHVALQRDPAVALAHAKVMGIIESK